MPFFGFPLRETKTTMHFSVGWVTHLLGSQAKVTEETGDFVTRETHARAMSTLCSCQSSQSRSGKLYPDVGALKLSKVILRSRGRDKRNHKHTNTHANTQSHNHTSTQTHTNTQTYKHTNRQTQTQTETHTNTQTHKHTNMQTHKHANTQTRKHANTNTQTRKHIRH